MDSTREGMDMAVLQKPGRGWVAQVYAGEVDGKKRYISRSAGSQAEARVIEAELKVAVAQGKAKPSSGMTLGDVLAAFIDNLHGSASTIYDYRLRAKRIPASLTRLRLREVTPQKLDAYYRTLRKAGLS